LGLFLGNNGCFCNFKVGGLMTDFLGGAGKFGFFLVRILGEKAQILAKKLYFRPKNSILGTKNSILDQKLNFRNKNSILRTKTQF
jgi:hypothetical protein